MEKLLRVWCLLTENRTEYMNISYETHDTEENFPQITTREVSKALMAMKSGRAPGPGGIPIEFIKTPTLQVPSILWQIFNKCLEGN